MSTIQGKYLKILDLREGNEESSEETTGCKASVYKEFDDCMRIGNFVEILRFRHSTRVIQFERSAQKTYKKAISDGIDVSVVIDVECGNILIIIERKANEIVRFQIREWAVSFI